MKMTPLHGYQLGRYNVRQEIVNFCNIFLVFLFGAAIQQTSVNIGKFTTGRLRPHFLAACKPNYTAFSCVDDFHQPQYVAEDVCTAEEEYKTLDMRYSLLLPGVLLFDGCYLVCYSLMDVAWCVTL